MGSSSSKDSRPPSRPSSLRQVSGHAAPGLPSPSSQVSPGERLTTRIYESRNGSGRGSRHDLSFLHIGRDRDSDQTAHERPRETKQEKEARRAERDRVAREKERERSMQEEGVDGGFLVTLGTYTGPEDFSKSVVRQLQIERRLAPFWKGLNDHSDSWTEHQLVAAVRGLPIPAPDEVPPEMARTGSQASNDPRSSGLNINSLTVPISSRSQSYQSDISANLSASHPAFSSGPSSPTGQSSTSSQLFRGRAKTLASLAAGTKSQSPDLTPQEIRLPRDPYVNGLPLEAYLYREVSECPICFLYYPIWLNKTRCCDQPICSECFVQIKRPDPHPPEHEQPGQQRLPEEEADMLVSEVAACPFCVTPEFGVSYDAPPFRRGLAYPNHAHGKPWSNPTSAISSTTSLTSNGNRRRATSLSVNAPQVITTDRVRPDWAKKLADARAHALRRSAAATALHNAAYVLGNNGDQQIRGGLMLGRRRRTLFGDSPAASGSGTPRMPEGMGFIPLLRLYEATNRMNADGSGDLVSGRSSSRRNRVDDLEDLMMMEAIRLSLAEDDARQRKQDKENKKEEKKKAKEAKKEAKQEAKLAKKNGGSSASLYPPGSNDSTSTWATTSMARSTSNLGQQPIPEEEVQGKGKAPAQDFAGFNPLFEPSSTSNTEMRDNDKRSGSASPPVTRTRAKENPQGHLEASRASIQHTPSAPIPMRSSQPHLRQLSNASSVASSFGDSAPSSLRMDLNLPSASGSGLDVTAGAQDTSGYRSGTPPAGGNGLEPMLNFRSLAAMIGEEDKGRESEHIEHAEPPSKAEEELKEPSPTGSPRLTAGSVEGNRSRGDSGESSHSAPPPIYVEQPPNGNGRAGDDEITPAPQPQLVHNVDQKHYGDINVLAHGHAHEATQ